MDTMAIEGGGVQGGWGVDEVAMGWTGSLGTCRSSNYKNLDPKRAMPAGQLNAPSR